MITLHVHPNDENKRLDNFIAKCYPNLLKTLIYKWLRTKKIKVNNKKQEPNYRLQPNDEIVIYLNEDLLNNAKEQIFAKYQPDELFLQADCKNLQVIYENEDLLIVNKPIGVLSHTASKTDVNVLINQIKKYLYLKHEYDPNLENSFAPALCNRLDRNTQGLVIACKNAKALKKMNEAISNRQVSKDYYCFCYGKFDSKEGLLKNFMHKDEAFNKAVVNNAKTEPNDKIALLKYRVIAYYPIDNISMLDVKLLTGRFHQIRAQLSHVNHPLVGDGKYYDPKAHQFVKQPYKSQLLVAYKLTFSKKLSAYFFHINDEMVFSVPNIYKELKQLYPFK